MEELQDEDEVKTTIEPFNCVSTRGLSALKKFELKFEASESSIVRATQESKQL